MAYDNGIILWVKYDVGDPTVHARFLCAFITGQRYVALTPNGDMYDENYTSLHEFTWVRVAPTGGGPMY